MDVIWKFITVIIDRHLTDSIEFHYLLNVFREQRGMGKDALEEKNLQNIAGISQAVLYEIFYISTWPIMHWTGGTHWKSLRGTMWTLRYTNS